VEGTRGRRSTALRDEEALVAAEEAVSIYQGRLRPGRRSSRPTWPARPKNAGQDMPSVLFGVVGLQTVEAERSENECLIPQICLNRLTTFEIGGPG
jgi:hypothetical protein